MAREVWRPAGESAVSRERGTASAPDDGRDPRRGRILGPGGIPDMQGGYVQEWTSWIITSQATGWPIVINFCQEGEVSNALSIQPLVGSLLPRR